MKKESLLWKTWIRTAAKSPSKAALIDARTGHTLNCEDLTQRAAEMAEKLSTVRGCPIAFCLPNAPRWLIKFLAIQKAGGAAIPLDASLGVDTRQAIARLLGAEVLWQDDCLIPLIAGKRAPAGAACIKATSGSTGEMKPVDCTADQLLADAKNIIATMGISASDRNLAVIPFGHSYGLGNIVIPLILQGTAAVCAPEFVPRQILEWVEQYNVTVVPAVPAIYKLLAELEKPPKLKSWKLAISAGATLPPETAQKFLKRFGIKIHNFYGSSETGGIAYDKTGEASLSGRAIGKPLSGVKVSIDERGHVRVRSKAAVSARGVALPDLGEITPRGELQLKGRTGGVANIGGRKVHSGEIEGLLRAMKGVSDAWVTVMRDPRGRDFLAAAVETRRTISTIEKDLSRQLAAWKLPKRYFVQSMLPRTGRGKLDTVQLQKTFEPPSKS
jgi:long-chain acyl-CoA synthetase